MYIIELIAKIITQLKNNYSDLTRTKEEKTYEKCEHFFVPIDSTSKILACTKCGYIIKNNN